MSSTHAPGTPQQLTGLRGAITRRAVKVLKGPMESTRSPRAAEVLTMPVQPDANFDALRGGAHALLVTYKRSGDGVPTPVWFALDDDGRRLYVWTELNAYKAKRLRRNPDALLAPCDPRGAPLGPPIAATGRILETRGERAHAAAVIGSRWNAGQRLFERIARPLMPTHYLEFVPAHPATPDA
ncbi:MAG: PPOX class F420-dependent oxidoreductase [Patulibacter minatonensis]